MSCPTADRPPRHLRRLLVSASPRAGARSAKAAVEVVAVQLAQQGYAPYVTDDIDELQGLAAQWHEAGELRAVLACGGDGTASLVRHRVPLDVPLLPVPMGNENLLSGYLSQAATPAAVATTVAEGVSIGLDLGIIRQGEPLGQQSPSAAQYFLIMLSAGFDAEVVDCLHQRRRGHVTRSSYLKPMLKTIRSYEYPDLRLYCDDTPDERATCRWALAFNLPLYACGWRFAPAAVGTDQLLDVCAFERGSTVQMMRYMWHVLRGNHHRLADVRCLRQRRFRLEAADGSKVAYQLDGDSGGVLPIDVELLPGALRLLVMPEVATRMGFSLDAPTSEGCE